MEKIKVLIVAGSMNMGGLENQLMHLLRQADKERFQIDYTTTVDHPYYEKEILELGAKCIRLPKTHGRHFKKYCDALYKVLQEGKYDVVHSHELFHSGMVLQTAKKAGVPKRFAHAHSSNQDYGHDIVRHLYDAYMRRLILKNGNGFFACSSIAAKFLYGENILENPNYHLIVNSVDTEKFLSDQVSENLGDVFDPEWKNILQVGRFSPEKNEIFIPEIAKEFKKRNVKIRFICAGNDGGDYEKLVLEKIEEYGVQDYVHLLGKRMDVDQLMKKADAFILPSIFEGMPLTLIEAQASGLPCVVSDRFSHEVDFNIGAVQWLKLEDDPAVWADAFETAIENGKIDKEKVVEAIQKYGFDSKEFTKRICRFYEE